MNNVYITRMAAFLPNEAVDNEAMETVLGKVGGQFSRARRPILRSNGIQRRYYVLDPETGKPLFNNAELTAEAITQLTDDNFSVENIDLLACGTSSPDQLMPNHAVMVQGVLGTHPCEAVATAGICLSGLAAFKYAYLSVLAGDKNHAVATGSEIASTFMHARLFTAEADAKVDELGKKPELAFEKDFLRWMLSDGAGTALLESQPNANGRSLRVDFVDSISYANSLETCMYAGAEKGADGRLIGWREFEDFQAAINNSVFSVKQDVRLLNENITRVVIEETLPNIIQKRGLRAEEIDFFLPHMSSEYFRPRIAESLRRIDFDIPMERWFTNLTQTGNVGSAAFYVILNELFHSSALQPGQRLLAMVPESGRFSVGYVGMTVV